MNFDQKVYNYFKEKGAPAEWLNNVSRNYAYHLYSIINRNTFTWTDMPQEFNRLGTGRGLKWQ